MAAMGRTGMKRLELGEGEFKLVLEREGVETVKIIESPSAYSLRSEEQVHRRADEAFTRGGHQTTTPPAPVKPTLDESKKEDGSFVTSPMVGTYYSSSSPDQPAFVKVGDNVNKDSVLCIVEAMKVMNEIKSGVDGTVAEVLVENSHPVEFGTPLFRIVKE
ncbi:MAG: acetyl-CoA carboxylase biotin carboxyl carrier protein [Chlamydiales bacterium]|nr:acetyl-CoA carboxylase biotin carboxyl carrier protein [Chlamydiia bacterium]MCP5507212.1 acetyl-CoA carboxylase biotin carboxyl carrier protein [Chlamydiales bacterium]